jgi:IS5 family transposase
LVATRKIALQTRQRVAGMTPDGATRPVSLHDPDARPIAKGRLGKPVEFGYKAQLVDNEDGIVLDHDVQHANPADAPRLAPAIERVHRPPADRRGSSPPTAATASRTSTTPCTTSASATSSSPARADPPALDRPSNTDQPSAAP